MFKHIISLGHFCSVAQELERLGLRDASYPFDWLITKREPLHRLINNHFDGFLEYDNLYQSQAEKNIYRNKYYDFGVSFYHDFSRYIPLDAQLDEVQKKYARRIERFYTAITEPTLFIRYVNNEDDAEYYSKHSDERLAYYKQFCSENELIFVVNDEYKNFNIPNAYYVEKDKNDTVARRFADKNKVLLDFLLSDEIYDKNKRQKNLAVYNENQKKKQHRNSAVNKVLKKAENKLRKQYTHNRTVNE